MGVTVLAVCDPGAAAPTETRALLTVAPPLAGVGSAVLRHLGRPSAPVPFTPLAAGLEDAERVALRLAPKRLVADSIRAGRSSSGRLVELLGSGLRGPLRAAGSGPGGHGRCWRRSSCSASRSRSPLTGRRWSST